MQMLRRRKVRSRLVAVIAVPLVLLLAVVVPGAFDRRAIAQEADRAAQAAEDVAAVAAAVDALQGERTLSAALRAGAGPDVERALAVQRSITDDALERADGALRAVATAHPALAGTTGAALDQVANLALVREELDTTVSDVPWIDPFAPILDGPLEVQESVGSVTSELGMGDRLSAVALVARSKEAAASQDAQMAAATSWGELRGEQAVTLGEQRTDEAAYRAAYLAASPPGAIEARRDEILQDAVTQTGRYVDAVASGAPLGALSAWLDQSAARQQALREVEATRAAEALDAIETVEAAANETSARYLVLAAAGLLLALGLALAAARSITRPLRELTDAADHLASDRLPLLVDTLRNPGLD
jgi:hypothetical protein